MNLCLRKVKIERKKAFHQWRKEFGKKYREWLRERNEKSLNGTK